MAKKKTIKPKLRFKDDEGKEFPDWEEKKLEDVAEIIGGGTPDTTKPQYWEGEVQWFTPTELKRKYVSRSKRTITEEGLKASSAKLLPVGTLLLSTRATVGDISIALQPCATNQGFQSLVVNEHNCNEFIYYWLLKNKNLLLEKAKGSTFLEIGKTEVRKILIEVPSLEEQKKIADFLSAIDAKIENLEKELEELKAYKKGVMQALFASASDATERRSDGATERRLKIEALQGTKKHGFFIRFKDENGKDYPDWKSLKLKEIANLVSGFPFDSNLFSDNGYKLMIPKNFSKSGYPVFSRANTKYTTEIVEERYICKSGDLLVLLTDLTPSCELLGKPALIRDEDGEVLLNQRIVRIEGNPQIVTNRFLMYYLLTDSYHKRIKETATGSTVRHSSNKILMETIVPLPSIKEQKQIASFLTAIDEKIDFTSNQIQNTRQYKQALLQQLFN